MSRKVRRRGPRRVGAAHEWIGARFEMPSPVVGEGPEYYPLVNIWIEQPEGFVVASSVTHPDECAGSLGAALLGGMRSPMIGPPRHPRRIRVAEQELAAEVAQALRGVANIPVVVAPTPEALEVAESMAAALGPSGPESYLGDGLISAEVVGALFDAAARLYACAPWKTVDDSQVIRLDIDDLGLRAACLSIIGNLGESFGFLIFPTFEEYLRFGDERAGGRHTLLALTYEPASAMPEPILREVAEHSWRLAGPNAYPMPMMMAGGESASFTEADVRIATACAAALVAFFLKYDRELRMEEIEPICASFVNDDDVSVRFTAPYEASPLFEINDSDVSPPRHAKPRVGRNEPCPCGSGKKYKKCHLDADTGKNAVPAVSPIRELDERMVATLLDWVDGPFDGDLASKRLPFVDPESTVGLFAPWLVYVYEVRGRSIADWFLQEPGNRLSSEERAWLVAQQSAWLSVWEVESVTPGRGMRARDLLSGAVRDIVEAGVSSAMNVRECLLARVVDHSGVFVFSGTHPQPLPPRDAASVVQKARKRLRRKNDIPAERLRNAAFAAYLIRRWEDACDEMLERQSVRPTVCNTDGDPILQTTDHFCFDPNAMQRVEDKLVGIGGVSRLPDGVSGPEFVFTRPGNAMNDKLESTTLAIVRIAEGRLSVQTNSIVRADDFRARLEEACGDLIEYRLRDHTDPQSTAHSPRAAQARDPADDDPEMQRIAREYKERHYATWPDHPLPALGGKTPRQAMKTAAGREKVELLVKEIENLEHKVPEPSRFDCKILRSELGLRE